MWPLTFCVRRTTFPGFRRGSTISTAQLLEISPRVGPLLEPSRPQVPGSRTRLLVVLKLNIGRLFPCTGFLPRPGRCIQERSSPCRICSAANGVTPTERANGHFPFCYETFGADILSGTEHSSRTAGSTRSDRNSESFTVMTFTRPC
jgi:hypothetical protein